LFRSAKERDVQSPIRSEGASINGRYLINDTAETRNSSAKNFNLSFEVFPAKNAAAQDKLLSELSPLMAYKPDYISVTYGAGGQSRDGTLQTGATIQRELGTDVMAHLTLVGQSRDDVLLAADQFKEAGIKQILALRGDEPIGQKSQSADSFASSVDLIGSLSKRGWQCIRTTAYPDAHKDSLGEQADLDWLLAKFDAGACEAITQFFFNAESFLRLRDGLDRYGAGHKLVPGLLAFSDAGKMTGFARRCGVPIPEELVYELSATDDAELFQAHAVSVLLDLWLRLEAEGISRYHIYTLNKSQPTLTLLKLLEVSTG
jgi:methylenetetrahydrofolate reductase (NADPH)